MDIYTLCIFELIAHAGLLEWSCNYPELLARG